MARPNKKTEERKPEWVEVDDGVSIRLSKGDFFSLSWYGAVIHGCSVRTGRNGAFIGYPSFKGTDGNYIKRAYVYAAPNSQDEKTLALVLETVIKERAKEEKENGK